MKNLINIVADLAAKAQPLPMRIKDYYIQHGYKWHEANIIGVRFAKDFYTNKFLDVLAVVTDSEIISLRATTVPGPNWTPENCKKLGIAYASIICLGYYENAYGFTNHSGHPKGMALGQRVGIPCFRDNNRDSKMQPSEGPYIEKASAGMNIHTQKDGDNDEAVNFSSAGCQVAQNRALFLSRYMPVFYSTKEAKKGTTARFSYLLVDDSADFAAELKKLAI